MSQTTQTVEQKSLWALVSTLKDNTKEADLQRITPEVIELVDEWQSKGGMMWSGSLDDNKTGMAVFAATKEDAKRFYEKYDKLCSGVLVCHLYQWDAMPILSLF
ncbi:MAG: hypothetical protein ACREAE_00580 [Nitrosopumilaceae archaeon]